MGFWQAAGRSFSGACMVFDRPKRACTDQAATFVRRRIVRTSRQGAGRRWIAALWVSLDLSHCPLGIVRSNCWNQSVGKRTSQFAAKVATEPSPTASGMASHPVCGSRPHGSGAAAAACAAPADRYEGLQLLRCCRTMAPRPHASQGLVFSAAHWSSLHWKHLPHSFSRFVSPHAASK